MGDITHIMPAIQPTVGGFYGDLHSREMLASDDYSAYVIPAKIMALTVFKLLSQEGKRIKQVKENFKPLMTKEEYLQSISE